MAVQKNFSIRNGLEVNEKLLVADSVLDRVGIGSTTPKYTFEVIGGIGATDINILGISTVLTEFNVGTGGTVITSLNTGLTGFGTQIPAYIVDIRSPVSTGQTALYVQGDVRITGDVYADDISLDQATFTNLEVSGVGTIATAPIDLAYVKTGIVTNLSTSGIATIATASVDLAYVKTGIVTNLSTSGIATITTAVVGTANVNTGVVTTISGSNLNYSGIGSFGSANIPTARIVTGIVTTIDNANLRVSGIASVNTGVVTSAFVNTGIITTLSGSNLNYSGIGSFGSVNADTGRINTGIVTNLTTSGIGTITTAVIGTGNINTGVVTTISGSNLNYSGIGSFGSVNAATGRITTGIITTLTGTTLNYSGIGTITNFNATNTNVSGVTTTGSLAVNSGFDVYATNATFHNDVTINGNLSIGGTSTIINAAQLRVEDKDIVLGFTTSQTPTDDTANHGGIAIASTEGTPLVSLAVAGINTLPDTYKQIMWVKRNTMGAGTTDAFLFNYGVGIGSTQVPTGVRLSVGSVQISDNLVNTTNLNATGVTTSNSYNIGGTQVISSGRQLQNIVSLDATTTATIETAIANAPNTFTDITVSGLSTFVGVSTFNSGVYVSGIATFQNNVSIADSANLYIGTGNDLRIFHNGSNSFIQDNGTGNLFIDASSTYYRAASHLIQNNSSSETLATFTENSSVALYFDNVKEFETTGYGATVFGTLQTQQLNVSGVSTISTTNISGDLTFTGNNDLYLKDSGVINFGDSNDLQIYHNGVLSVIREGGTGGLLIDSNNEIKLGKNGTGNDTLAIFTPDGSVELYYDNVKEFETTGYGATVYGVLQSQGLNSSGIGTISVNSSSDALRITQTGAGNALVVEDSTNPDATPFVVTGIGSVGIGTNNPAASLHAVHPNTTAVSLTWGATSGQILRNEDSELAFGLNSFSPFSYYLQARTNASASRQIAINPLGGNVGIATSGPSTTLDVGGTASIKVPVGTTGERPGSPVRGFVRFNTDLNTFEGYNGTEWGGLGGAAEKDTAVSTTSATTCESFAVSTHRSATITAQITQGSNYQIGKYVVIHDGTTATLIEESAIATGSMLGSFTATISGGNLLFQVNMSSSSSATVTTLMTKVSV